MSIRTILFGILLGIVTFIVLSVLKRLFYQSNVDAQNLPTLLSKNELKDSDENKLRNSE